MRKVLGLFFLAYCFLDVQLSQVQRQVLMMPF